MISKDFWMTLVYKSHENTVSVLLKDELILGYELLSKKIPEFPAFSGSEHEIDIHQCSIKPRGRLKFFPQVVQGYDYIFK